MEPEAKRQKLDITGRRVMKSYKRYDKPPYSYVGMTALILRAAPRHQLSLAGILNTLPQMFPFFNGEYQGWKDSVRHNLSNSDCFYKVKEIVNNVARIKKCSWAVDLQKLPADAMVKQDCRKTKEYYASTLTEHFNLPPIHLIQPGSVLSIATSKLANPPSEHFEDAQPFREPERQRAPRKSRQFSIDSLIDPSKSSKSPFEPAYIRHIQFPKTMFDDQTPEKALENLRQLCGTDCADQKPKLDSSLEPSSSAFCDITNSTISQDRQRRFPTIDAPRSILSRQFAAPHITPARSCSLTDVKSESLDSYSAPDIMTPSRQYCTASSNFNSLDSFPTPDSTPTKSCSFIEPVTPTNTSYSIVCTPIPSYQQATRITSTPLPSQSSFGTLNTFRPLSSSSPFSSGSFTSSPFSRSSRSSPIYSPTDLSLTSPSGIDSTFHDSPLLQLACNGASFANFSSPHPQMTNLPYRTSVLPRSSPQPDHFVERSFFF